ncbi:MAG TPA: hypothetical protein VI977_01110 [archaeon]|nr:hypothetical protein [archaeon]
MQGRRIARRKPGNAGQALLPFELAEKREKIISRISGLEADIHMHTRNYLEGGPAGIRRTINRLKGQKLLLEQRLREIQNKLP